LAAATTGRVLVSFCTRVFFRKSIEKAQVELQSDKKDGYTVHKDTVHKDTVHKDTVHKDTVHKEQTTFWIISRLVLLRIRSDSDKNCSENQNKHFMLSDVFFFRKS
jgi:hypothetical protein